jgi:hypothetical protein
MKITFMIIIPIILITICLSSAKLFSMEKGQNFPLTRLTRSKSCPEFKDIVIYEKEVEEISKDELWKSIKFLARRVDTLEKQNRCLILGVLDKVNFLSENVIELQGYYVDFQKTTALSSKEVKKLVLKNKKSEDLSDSIDLSSPNSLPYPEEPSITKEKPTDSINIFI